MNVDARIHGPGAVAINQDAAEAALENVTHPLTLAVEPGAITDVEPLEGNARIVGKSVQWSAKHGRDGEPPSILVLLLRVVIRIAPSSRCWRSGSSLVDTWD